MRIETFGAGDVVRLAGSPIDLLRASDKTSGHAQLFAGNVRIDGDTSIAHRFSDALGGLDIDWEEQLSQLTGDIAAHEIGRGVRAARREGERLSPGAIAVTVTAFLFSVWAVWGAGLDSLQWGAILLVAGIAPYAWIKRRSMR